MKQHWSVDETELKKDPIAHTKWRLENAINWGLRDGKINEAELRAHWDSLDIDPYKRRFLELLLSA